MIDIFFYMRFITAIGFLILGIGFYLRNHEKIQSKNDYLPSILYILAGIFLLVSALLYALT